MDKQQNNGRKLPFQSPPPNKIIYQDDYSSPQLVFLPQTPESSGTAHRPIRFDDFDDQPLTPIVSSKNNEADDVDSSIWDQGNAKDNEEINRKNDISLSSLESNAASSEFGEKIEVDDGTIFYNERAISPIPSNKNDDDKTEQPPEDEVIESQSMNDSMNDDENAPFQQQGERIDINDKASIKKNKKNKMIRMVDEDDEYDDPFSHIPEIIVPEEVLQNYSNDIKEEVQPKSNISRVPSSGSSKSKTEPVVEEYGFHRADSMHEVELMEVKTSKTIQDRFSNLVTGVEKLLSPATNRMRDGGDNNYHMDEYEITSDKKKILSDERGSAMSGIFEKLSSLKLNSSTVVETAPKEPLPPTEEDEEDSFLNDIILSGQNQNNKLPNANVPPTQSSTNTSFMAQSWVEKLKRIDVSSAIAHEFFVACQESDLDSVKSYIEDKNLNVNTKDLVGYGQTALHYACWNGSLKLVEYLLSKEASVDALNDYKQTPLHEASFRGHPDIVSMLLKAGADKTCKDHVGETALDYAKKKRNEATNFTSESLYKDVIKALDSHLGDSNPRKRTIPCCFQ